MKKAHLLKIHEPRKARLIPGTVVLSQERQTLVPAQARKILFWIKAIHINLRPETGRTYTTLRIECALLNWIKSTI